MKVESKYSFFILLILTFLGSVCWLNLIGTHLPQLIDIDTTTINSSLNFDWFTISNLPTNAYLNWRYDPLTILLTQLSGANACWKIHMLIFSVGLFILISYRTKRNFSALIVALCTPMLAVVTIGFDTVALTCITFVPWLLLSLKFTGRGGFLLALVSVLLVCFSANQYALLIVAMSLTFTHLEGSKQESKWALLLLPLTYLMLIPKLSIANYPALSHVVPGYNTADGLFPMIGDESPIPIIDRNVVRTTNLYLASGLFIAAICAALSAKRTKSSNALAAFVFAISFVILMDSAIIPAKYGQIAPLASLARIIPENIFYPLSLEFFAVGLTLLALLCSLSHFGTILMIGLLCTLIALSSITSSALIAIGIPNSNISSLINNNPQLKALSAAQIISPSMYIIRHLGTQVFSIPKIRDATTLASLNDFPHQLRSSHNQELLPLLSDSKERTRWYSGQGMQIGDEWIEIILPQPLELQGISMELGKYPTDFPRGLVIEATDNHGQKIEVISAPDWQGAIEFTQDGFPYFDSQADVRIEWPNSINTTKLMIKQVGHARFDWTIAEIRLAVSTKSRKAL